MTHQPCNNCPFRSDKPFRGLRRSRAIELAQSLLVKHGFFQCHKTVDYAALEVTDDVDEEIDVVETSEELAHPCIGAVLFVDHLNADRGGCLSNLAFALSASSGHLWLDQLDRDSPVCKSLDEFLDKATID